MDIENMDERDKKILSLFKSGIKEDVKLAIILIFDKYPEIREFTRPYGPGKYVVDYHKITHIVPWIKQVGQLGMVTPEYWDNE